MQSNQPIRSTVDADEEGEQLTKLLSVDTLRYTFQSAN